MATRVVAGREQMGIDELERELSALISHVQRGKESVKSSFQQLHSLLAAKELSLLQEIDEMLERARHKLTEKIRMLKELETARESTERDLTENKLKDVLEKNLRTLEDKIGEELSRGVSVGWVELDWRTEQLEQAVIDVCNVMNLRKHVFRSKDYTLIMSPIWSHATGPRGAGITHPMQIAIDNKTQNIFVVDNVADQIFVFNEKGFHLNSIPTAPSPIGIALTDKHIYVSAGNQLLKIGKSNRTIVRSVETEKTVWGLDMDKSRDIYGCEFYNNSLVVYNKYLVSLRRIELNTLNIGANTCIASIKLYADNMYVMFGEYPPFHLQIFSLEGELQRCLIQQCEIDLCYFFSIDQLGNIIVADWVGNQIKIFTNEGEVIHTINNGMFPADQKLVCPRGVAINRDNMIIVAHENKQCNLLSF